MNQQPNAPNPQAPSQQVPNQQPPNIQQNIPTPQTPQPIPGRTNWLVTILIVILAIGVAGVIVYFWQKSENESKIKELEAQIKTLESDFLKSKDKELSTKESEEESQDQELTYENSEYGFTLTFPESWRGYKAYKEVIEDSTYINFGFPEQDSLFIIGMYTKSDWQEINASEGPKPTYITENSEYVFAWSHAQDAASMEMAQRIGEVSSIITTFQLK